MISGKCFFIRYSNENLSTLLVRVALGEPGLGVAYHVSFFAMNDAEANGQKAMAAVRAMFDKYELLEARRPEHHAVRRTGAAFSLWVLKSD